MRLPATAVLALMALAAALPVSQVQAAAACIETSVTLTQSNAMRAMAKAVAAVARDLVGERVLSAAVIPAADIAAGELVGALRPADSAHANGPGRLLAARLLDLPPPGPPCVR